MPKNTVSKQLSLHQYAILTAMIKLNKFVSIKEIHQICICGFAYYMDVQGLKGILKNLEVSGKVGQVEMTEENLFYVTELGFESVKKTGACIQRMNEGLTDESEGSYFYTVEGRCNDRKKA